MRNIRNMQMLKQNVVNANCLYNTYDNIKYIYIIRYCTQSCYFAKYFSGYGRLNAINK